MTEPSGPAGSTERAALENMLRARANAVEVLTAVSNGSLRFTQIREATGLKDMQINRVLVWALRTGLLTRTGSAQFPGYELSGLGETLVRSISTPAWIQVASVLVRLILKGRLRGGDLAAAARDAASVTGLPLEQTRRMVEILAPALRPESASALRECLHLHPAAGEHLVFSPWTGMEVFRDDARPWEPPQNSFTRTRFQVWGESLVVRTLERAGIDAGSVRELVHHAPIGDEAAQPVTLPLAHPVISVSRENPVSHTLLREYGAWSDPTDDEVQLRFAGERAVPFALRSHGMLIRLFDEMRGISHFVLFGGTAKTTYAACRVFYERVECFLDEVPERSFACVVQTDDAEHAPPGAREVAFGVLDTVSPSEDWLPLEDSKRTGLVPLGTRMTHEDFVDRRSTVAGRRDADLVPASACV